MQLNEEQTLAVEHPLDYPACLIAGAGSGKTRVLTERVRWLIKKGLNPRQICAITFTNKAADELVSRLGLTESTPFEQMPRVSTIHSLALGAIRKNPEGFGFEAKISPLDDYDQKQLMKRIIEREKVEGTSHFAVLEKIQFHRARGVGFAKDYTDEIHELALKQHSGYHALDKVDVKLWRLYEEEKTKNSVVDFDDMLHLTVRRFRNDAKWRAAIQSMWAHVLMDEAQDTNPVQWEFVNFLLSPSNKNLYVVGDMSQSIYGFNGAVPKILKDFSEDWRGMWPKLYRIARNHRSVPEVVKLANVIQSKMTQTIPLKMESWRGTQGDHGETQLLRACLPEDIAASIASEIARDNDKYQRDQAAIARGDKPRVSAAKPIPFRNNAILVRASSQIRELETELVRRRIKYVVRGGYGLKDTEECRDVLAYLKFAVNTKDFASFCRASRVPKCGIGDVALEKLRNTAREKFKGNLLEAARLETKLVAFVGVIDVAAQFRDTPVSALNYILTLTKYPEYISGKYKKDPEKVKTKLENIQRLIQMVEALHADGMSIEDLIFLLTMDKLRDNDPEGAVVISTIHSAKGLEWERVYVHGVVEGYLPHKWSVGSEEEIEEERRLFYVAATRARDWLVLCIHDMQRQGPNNIQVKPSRFLAEVGVQ